jgi:hypothetical protein
MVQAEVTRTSGRGIYPGKRSDIAFKALPFSFLIHTTIKFIKAFDVTSVKNTDQFKNNSNVRNIGELI